MGFFQTLFSVIFVFSKILDNSAIKAGYNGARRVHKPAVSFHSALLLLT